MNLFLIKVISNALDTKEEEFVINGKLYDVLEKKCIADSIYIYGIEDSREELAVHSLGETFGVNQAILSSRTSNISRHLSSVRVLDILLDASSANTIQKSLLQNISRELNSNYPAGFLKTVNPPPQVLPGSLS